MFERLEPSPSNEEATTACPVKFLTVIAELLFATAAEEDKADTKASLCV